MKQELLERCTRSQHRAKQLLLFLPGAQSRGLSNDQWQVSIYALQPRWVLIVTLTQRGAIISSMLPNDGCFSCAMPAPPRLWLLHVLFVQSEKLLPPTPMKTAGFRRSDQEPGLNAGFRVSFSAVIYAIWGLMVSRNNRRSFFFCTRKQLIWIFLFSVVRDLMGDYDCVFIF